MAKSTTSEQVNPFGDLTKMLEQFKVPGFDMSAIVESRRKDIDSLVAANQATLDSMQTLASKQTELLTQAMQGVQDAASALTKSGAGAPDPVKYAELARKAYEKALTDMKDMAEMARNAQADVMSGVSQRASQSLQEIKALTQPKK